MLQKVLPNNLQYSQLKPIGYPSSIKQEKFTPISFSGANNSDIIRFNISSMGFWDPYSAYIKIEVDVTGMDTVGMQILDTSAHSYISQLTIYNSGTELERIEEYDTLATMLIDMNYSSDNRVSRLNEGIMSNSVNKNKQNSIQYTETTAGGSGNKTQVGFQPFYYQNIPMPSNYTTQYLNDQWNMAQNSGGVPALQIRYEFIEANQSYSTVQPYNLYSRNGGATGSTNFYNDIGTYATQALFITNACSGNNLLPGQIGYQQAFNQSLSNQSDIVFSTNYYCFETYKGQLYQPILKTKATFTIPLISGLLGILMPKESYKYIPMRSLQQLILEFRMNPYAMFTSGYTDIVKTTGLGSYAQQKRVWKISKFEINVEMQYFESNITDLILQSLNDENGIILHTNSWQLGPKFSIPANTTPNGTYQLNLGFESLRNIVWCYMPDDFATYTFCRKQFRLSANITSYQFKIGSQYYPLLPITGHGGTPTYYQSADTDFNNSEYLINLYKVFGKYQNTLQDCFVDNNNFAVNQRPYNISDIAAFMNASSSVTNPNTAWGQSFFHETRCIGKALYALNFETLNNDYSIISGINTTGDSRLVELKVTSDKTSPYAFPYTMYVFCQYDMLVQLKSSGCQVLGRG